MLFAVKALNIQVRVVIKSSVRYFCKESDTLF